MMRSNDDIPVSPGTSGGRSVGDAAELATIEAKNVPRHAGRKQATARPEVTDAHDAARPPDGDEVINTRNAIENPPRTAAIDEKAR